MNQSNNTYKFFAFISYRHSDIKAAKRLQALLEGYNLPAAIKRQMKETAPSRLRVFRDTDELTSGVLTEELQKRLDESKFLIVICSPRSAESKYVGDEIAYFRSLGRERRIIPFIIDGVPHSREQECFHPQLTLGGLELLGIDVQAEQGACYALRFHKAFIRTVAKMFDLDFGVLWNKRKRRLIQRAVGLLLLTVAIASTIGYFAVRAHRERPFDATVYLSEAGVQTCLPMSTDSRDSLFIYLDDNDIRKLPLRSLQAELPLQNLPGRYRNRPTRICCETFGYYPLDTIVNLTERLDIALRRNPEIYGRIRTYVLDRDGLPAVGARFDFGVAAATTDDAGLLDLLIPLAHQRPARYPVTVTYRGEERFVAFQREIDPLLDRPEVGTIMLE